MSDIHIAIEPVESGISVQTALREEKELRATITGEASMVLEAMDVLTEWGNPSHAVATDLEGNRRDVSKELLES